MSLDPAVSTSTRLEDTRLLRIVVVIFSVIPSWLSSEHSCWMRCESRKSDVLLSFRGFHVGEVYSDLCFPSFNPCDDSGFTARILVGLDYGIFCGENDKTAVKSHGRHFHSSCLFAGLLVRHCLRALVFGARCRTGFQVYELSGPLFFWELPGRTFNK